MKTTSKRTQRDYSLAFKLAVVSQVENGEMTYSKLRSVMPDPSPQTPEPRIKELEQQLQETQLKADFFEAVVKVMDRDFGVRLSKKRKAELIKKKRSKS
ncbi:hypothetical protein TUMSATVNIG1_59470 (plasmid) [Vibrio nigripulchritudo]|nr:hypothetical protein VNTUMSATTG_58980 [Vibrio nigripulchritudo]BDU35338.1 hypothetical protein TUMSATVNIG1_59470 [Vibrio nigripulchritudo]